MSERKRCVVCGKLFKAGNGKYMESYKEAICVDCHNSKKKKSGERRDVRKGKGGEE